MSHAHPTVPNDPQLLRAGVQQLRVVGVLEEHPVGLIVITVLHDRQSALRS